jgi:hypothetical protein
VTSPHNQRVKYSVLYAGALLLGMYLGNLGYMIATHWSSLRSFDLNAEASRVFVRVVTLQYPVALVVSVLFFRLVFRSASSRKS